VDVVSATVATAAIEGASAVAINTATALVRGRRYVLGLPTGEQSWVRVSSDVSIGSPVNCPLSSPLPFAVPVGSTMFGCSLRRVLSLPETSMVGPMVVDWRVTSPDAADAEFTEHHEVVTRLVSWLLDEDELMKRMPEAAALRDSGDTSLAETIDVALEEHLLPRLRGKSGANGQRIREHSIVSTWPLVPAHVSAVRLLLCMQNPRKTKEDRDEARADLDAAIALALNDSDAWYDAPQDHVAVTPPTKPTNFAVRNYRR
jgi:hypothetical protein